MRVLVVRIQKSGGVVKQQVEDPAPVTTKKKSKKNVRFDSDI